MANGPFLELVMVSLVSPPSRVEARRWDQPETRLLRMAFEGWLPDDFPLAREGPVQRRFGRLPSCNGGWRRASPKKSSGASATRSSPRCVPARRLPTTAASAASPRRSPVTAHGGRGQMSGVGLPSGTGALSAGATSRTISRKDCRFEEGSSRRQAATSSSEGEGSRRGLKITS